MDELVATAILLLNAGHEATVHALGNSVKTLLENQFNPTKQFENEKTTHTTIEECLRIDAPLHLFTRFVLEDVTFAGVTLKKGQTVGLLLGAANHDADRYPNPRKLDFARGGEGHVSFGAGIHFCLGAPLARLEMAIGLTALYERLPKLRLMDKPVYADRFHFHGLEKLMVRAE
jgi:cytochrome P450